MAIYTAKSLSLEKKKWDRNVCTCVCKFRFISFLFCVLKRKANRSEMHDWTGTRASCCWTVAGFLVEWPIAVSAPDRRPTNRWPLMGCCCCCWYYNRPCRNPYRPGSEASTPPCARPEKQNQETKIFLKNRFKKNKKTIKNGIPEWKFTHPVPCYNRNAWCNTARIPSDVQRASFRQEANGTLVMSHFRGLWHAHSPPLAVILQ